MSNPLVAAFSRQGAEKQPPFPRSIRQRLRYSIRGAGLYRPTSHGPGAVNWRGTRIRTDFLYRLIHNLTLIFVTGALTCTRVAPARAWSRGPRPVQMMPQMHNASSSVYLAATVAHRYYTV